MEYVTVVYWNHALVQHLCHLVHVALSPFCPCVHYLHSWLFLDQYSSLVVGPFLNSLECIDDIGYLVDWTSSLDIYWGIDFIGPYLKIWTSCFHELYLPCQSQVTEVF